MFGNGKKIVLERTILGHEHPRKYLLIDQVAVFMGECIDPKCVLSSTLTPYLATASRAPPSELLMILFMQLHTSQLVPIIQHMLCYTDLYLTSG